MTGVEDLSYRRITESIAGKLDLLEAYLFYCLALCSDCYTMVSNVKQETLTRFYGIKNDDQIREWLHKFEDLNLIQIDKQPIKGKYGSFDRCSYILNTEHYVFISKKAVQWTHISPIKRISCLVKVQVFERYKYLSIYPKWISQRTEHKPKFRFKIFKTGRRLWIYKKGW